MFVTHLPHLFLGGDIFEDRLKERTSLRIYNYFNMKMNVSTEV